MRIKNSKKGFVYITFMVIITIIAIASLVTMVLIKENRYERKRIGDIQMNALQTYQKAEGTLFLIDQAAKYSMYSAIRKLAEKGGRYDVETICGSYLGYPLIYDQEEECFPESIDYEFTDIYNEDLEQMLAGITAPGSIITIITQNSPLSIAGAGKDMLMFPISYKTEAPIQTLGYSGDCSSIPDYASRYLGTKYSSEGLVTPERAKIYGTTCASFVSSVYNFGFIENDYPAGDGYNKCDSSTMQIIGEKYKGGSYLEQLQPGDVISTLHENPKYWIEKKWTRDFGHTGIYVGKGRLEQQAKSPTTGDLKPCYLKFTPDENGKYIFIHSIGPVCYTDYDTFMRNLANPTLCRHVKCILSGGESSEETIVGKVIGEDITGEKPEENNDAK